MFTDLARYASAPPTANAMGQERDKRWSVSPLPAAA